MLNKHPCLLELPPNRVRRNYRGGRVLDALEGKAGTDDGNCPENWLCSLTEASNAGMTPIADEGLSRVMVDGRNYLLRDLIASAPEHYLGKENFLAFGVQTRFLAKLLDSSMRLHLQAHPTREFARRELGKPWGKFECYVIFSVRPGIDPYIYLGFQHPPTPNEWLRIVVEQDKTAMMACFEKIPVRPGEVWYVPGGYPHALGEGLTLLEVMEPSDLVVRCEFEREGVIVPPVARYMGLSPAEALRIFDYTPQSIESIRNNHLVTPELLAETESLKEYRRIGPQQIDCFEVRELQVLAPTTYDLQDRFAVCVVTGGAGLIRCGNEQQSLRPGYCYLLAAAAGQIQIEPAPSSQLDLLLCLPGQNNSSASYK
jgi:mannose-6-phosphate isomerase